MASGAGMETAFCGARENKDRSTRRKGQLLITCFSLSLSMYKMIGSSREQPVFSQSRT